MLSGNSRVLTPEAGNYLVGIIKADKNCSLSLALQSCMKILGRVVFNAVVSTGF